MSVLLKPINHIAGKKVRRGIDPTLQRQHADSEACQQIQGVNEVELLPDLIRAVCYQGQAAPVVWNRTMFNKYRGC